MIIAAARRPPGGRVRWSAPESATNHMPAGGRNQRIEDDGALRIEAKPDPQPRCNGLALSDGAQVRQRRRSRFNLGDNRLVVQTNPDSAHSTTLEAA